MGATFWLVWGVICAVVALVCIGIPSIAFADRRDSPWLLLLVALVVPLLALILLGLIGLAGANAVVMALIYCGGLALAALTLVWRYARG